MTGQPSKLALNAHIWEREEHEHYVEPEWVSRRLFDEIGFDGQIWDPCCGFGRIPDAALNAGYSTFASDIVSRGYMHQDEIQDFLSCNDNCAAANIVCNPPFDKFEQFAKHALSLGATQKVAMIWLVRRLNAARWLSETPLACIHLLTPRPSMPPGHVITDGGKVGGGKQDFCWLVWDKQHNGPPELRWLHRGDPT